MKKEITAKAHNANLTGSIEVIEASTPFRPLDDIQKGIYKSFMKRQKAKKKPKRKGFKNIRRDALDALFSEYIRRRVYHDGEITCQRCGGTYYDTTREDGSTKPAWMSLECAHFKGRGQHSVRFDPDNALAACSGCHTIMDSDPDEKIRVFEFWLGKERLDLLRARAVETGKIDRQAIKLWLKQKLEEMDG